MQITVRYANDYAAHSFEVAVEPDADTLALTDNVMGSETTTSVGVSPGKLRGWAEAIRNLRIPAIPAGQTICDGETWTVALSDGDVSTAFTWVTDVPAGWEALDRIARAIAKEAGATW